MKLQVDGKTVFAATGGRPFEAGKPAVIFLHGAGMDHTVWSLQTRYFAHHGWSVLAVDLPGHGRSDGPALTDLGDLAAWAQVVVTAAGGTRAVFAGHSMGALIALEAAARAGAAALGCMLLGVVPKMAVHPDLQTAADGHHHGAVENMVGWGFGRPAQIGGNRAPGSWIAGAGLRVLERGLAGPLGADLKLCNAYDGALEAAAQVTCPTLLLLGDDDRMTPAKAAQPLAEALADCHRVVLPATGHMMTLERPDEVLDVMRDFLKGIAL